jgi:hypothetical protein
MLSSRRPELALLCLGTLIAALGLGWGARRPAVRLEGTEESPKGLLLVLTGNEQGFIRPCGCSKPALGGVHRRATALKKLREKSPALHLVSGGDLVIAGDRQQRLKFESFLMSMALMEYEAFSPGWGELQLGCDYLWEMRTFAGFPFVSLNLFKGEEAFGERQVRIGSTPWVATGLLADGDPPEGFRVTKALPALLGWLAGLDVEKDRPLILFSGDEKGVLALAAGIPDAWSERVVIAFGGPSDQPTLLKAAEVKVTSLGSKGRFLCLLAPDDVPTLSSLRLEEEIIGDPDVSSILDSYRATLKDEKLVETFPRKPTELAYEGEASCVDCHRDSCEALDATPHERAWATLVATNDQWDPECASCHVTGWGDSTGFITEERTPNLINVTCEACHGPGEAHVATQAPTTNGKLGPRFCVKCHDADNSPQFDFETYWPKIAHPTKK